MKFKQAVQPIKESRIGDLDIKMQEIMRDIKKARNTEKAMEIFETMDKNELIFFINWLFISKQVKI